MNINLKTKTDLKLSELKIKEQITEKESELYQSKLYKEIQELKKQESLIKQQQKDFEDSIKETMLENGVDRLEKDGWELKISRRQGALNIKDEEEFLKEFPEFERRKEVIEVDKMEVKKQLKQGKRFPNVNIKENVSLLINKK